MRMSELLERNIIETAVGGILNKFKIKHRRNVLFFEDILANYIKECEDAGYKEEIKEIFQKWCVLTTKQLVPEFLKKLPLPMFFSFLKKMWINLGLMDDLNVIKNKNIIKIETKNEAVTRTIGKNNAMLGFYIGVLSVFLKSQIECVESLQTMKYCKYTFNINKPLTSYKHKRKKAYDKLNQLPNIKGFTLKDALKKGIFQLKKGNKLHFRGKPIIPGENTLSHLIGSSHLLLEKIPYISYDYFKEIIKKYSTDEEKLALIKTLLQVMGWGIIKIIKSKENIHVEIKNPPYGLQLEKHNWEFLIRTILGYLWLLDENIIVRNINQQYEKLTITYSNKNF